MVARDVFREEDVVDVIFAVVLLRCSLICCPIAVDDKLGSVDGVSFMQCTRVGEGAVR